MDSTTQVAELPPVNPDDTKPQTTTMTNLKTFAKELSQTVDRLQGSFGPAVNSLMTTMARTNQAMSTMTNVMELYLKQVLKLKPKPPVLRSDGTLLLSVTVLNTSSIPIPGIKLHLHSQREDSANPPSLSITRIDSSEAPGTPSRKRLRNAVSQSLPVTSSLVSPENLDDKYEDDGSVCTGSWDLKGGEYVSFMYTIKPSQFASYNLDLTASFPSPTSTVLEVVNTQRLYLLYQCQLGEETEPVLTGQSTSQNAVFESRVIRSLFNISLVEGIVPSKYYVASLQGESNTEGEEKGRGGEPVLQLKLLDYDEDGLHCTFECTGDFSENGLATHLIAEVHQLESCHLEL